MRKNRSKKRILFVHSTLHIGGAEQVTAHLCERLDPSRYDLFVCYLKEKGVVGEYIEAQGTEVIGVSASQKSKADYFTFLKLRKVIKTLEIDLVHSHDVHALADCSLCKLTRPPLRFIHTFHFGNYPQRDRSSQRLERLFWRIPDQLVAVSGHQRKAISRLYGMKEENIALVWNGVDAGSSVGDNSIVAAYRQAGVTIIGSINTLIEQKGMFDLLLVASRLKQKCSGRFVMLVAGDGHLKEALEAKARELGVEREVRFLGWVPQAAQRFLPLVDVFFQPSLWEAMSMVLLEALAAGKAVVATAVGETPLVVRHGVDGIVTEAKDIDAMTDALSELILDEKKREDMGRTAKARYLEAFTAEQMAARYQVLYDSLLDKD